MTTTQRARKLKWPYATYCALALFLTSCASTPSPRTSVLSAPAEIACSLPDPTGLFTLASCGAALVIRTLSDLPTSEKFERKPGTPTSGGNWDAPDAAK